MEILSCVLEVGKLLWTPVKRNVDDLVHYKSHMQSLEVLVEKLKAMKNDYQQEVNAALMNGDEVRYVVENWLKDAEKAIIDAEKLNNEAGEDKTCLGGFCPNLKWRYSLSKRAVKEAEEMNKLIEDKGFETVSLQVHRPIEFEYTMSTGDFEAFEATRQAMDRVMKALKDNNVTVIAVYGMGGIGKTTMVKHVGVQARKGKLFDHVIMAVVSQNLNRENIQQQLAEMLAFDLNAQTEIARAARLKERIMKGKNILIILDDIWDTIDLSPIGIPDHHELKNCKSKVLLTTRKRDVCHAMNSQENIHLSILSKEDSWALFVKKANRSFDESPDFSNIARKVAGECGGLPIALIAVARALGGKDLEEWRVAARRLEMSQTTNLDGEDDVYRCIKLSYDYLNGNDAKSFFLLCCLFPEDSDIQIEDLLRYGIGKGLFRDANSMQEARSTAHSVAKYLKACSLVLDDKKDGCVRMHDVIRDMAIRIASAGDGQGFFVKAGCHLKDWPKNSLEDYSAISLMENEICNLPDELVCPKLQILLLQSSFQVKEIPEDFFQSPNALRVFDISGTQISSLPSSFNLLTKLQTLHLDRCQSITDVSILGELKKLEVLSMRGSLIEELPEEIGHLTNLRMLDLTRSCFIATIPSNVISRLSKLEELYMQESFAEWGKKVEGEDDKTNASFDELISLSSLNILKVDISDAECLPKNVGFLPNWVNFDICIGARGWQAYPPFLSENTISPFSRALLLDTTINMLPDWFNSTVTERVEKIIYVDPKSLTDILVEHDRWKLNGLKFLQIRYCREMVTLMNTVTRVPNKPVFESLEELHVFDCNCMQQLCVGELLPGSLGNLKILMVRWCEGVADALVPSNLLRRLQNLEVLIVCGAGMVYIFRSQGLEKGETVLTKLREMKLVNLPELTNIWNGPAQPAMFHNLKTLTIFNCEKLKTLFTFEIAQCLLQLEELWVEYCHSLEKLFGLSEGLTVQDSEIIIPQLRILALRSLSKLTSVLAGSGTLLCPSLEYLHVLDCPQFLTSTSDFHSQRQVQLNNDQHFFHQSEKVFGYRL